MNHRPRQQNQEASSLIVDFPSHPRFQHQNDNNIVSSLNICPGPTNSSRPRSARFSQCSQMFIIENYDEVDHHKMWYTPEDKGPIKHQMVRDARRMGRVLASARAAGVTVPEEELCKCVGIEHLLSLEKARRTMEHRRNHIRTIVSSQYTSSWDELGTISEDSSEQARTRAASLAAGYWKMMSS